MKAYVVSRTLEFADGSRVTLPMGAYTDKDLAQLALGEDQTRLQALSQAIVVLPGGQKLPLAMALRDLGIKSVGNDGGELDVRESGLITPQDNGTPRIVLAR